MRLDVSAELADVIPKWKYGVLVGWSVILSLEVWAQDSTAVEYRYPNGAVSSEGWLINGIPAGFWRSFYEDGTRKSEGNWTKGALDGAWVFYDEKGRVETTLGYRNGLKDGEEQHWDSLGNPLQH